MGDSPTEPTSDSDDAVSDVGLSCETFVNAVPYGLFYLDRDGRVVTVNDAVVAVTGYDRDALVGTHVSQFLDAEDVIRAETAVRDRLLGGSDDAVHLSLPISTPTGETVPGEVCLAAVERNDEFRGTVGVVREVEDPDAAAGIRDAGERRQAFDALAEASADGIVMLDDDSVVRYANPAVERILGYAPEELVGASKMTVIPERLREAHTEAFQRYLDTGEKHIDWTYVELPGQHVDGHEVPLAISINEFTHDGEHYFVGTFRDISARKEVEQELEAQNERLDRFASMLAHELRNPLHVAQIYLDFVDDENGTANVEQIADALERIDDIIEVLLKLARGTGEIGEREAVSLSAVAADAWDDTETGTAEIEVVSDLTLRVNPSHLRQVLENLFRNSVDHNDDPVGVRVGALASGFYVEDTGRGIPEDRREKAVEAGYTTDEGGTGLGLTFVAELADAYGWEFRIAESDEGGARFEFADVEIVSGD